MAKKNIELIFEQSNDESVIIEMIQAASDNDGIIINAGAYTHTSIAIHDALRSSNSPAIGFIYQISTKRSSDINHISQELWTV